MKLLKLNKHLQFLKNLKFSEELKRQKINRDLFVFFIFLLVSTTFWFLNAMRETYVATFTLPLSFVNVPENEVVVESETESIQLRIKGTGFLLMRQYVFTKFSPPNYDVSKLLNIHRQGLSKPFLIPSQQRNYFSNQLFPELEIIEFFPDTIFVSLQKLLNRKVPVKLNGTVKLDKQFIISGQVVFDPDSVEVNGPKNIVDTLSAIFTKDFLIDKVRDSLVRSISLVHPKGLTVKEKTASMLIPVEPFSESSIDIPIDVIGIADSLRGKTFPSEVKITFRAGLSRFEKIKSTDFRAVIDVGDANTGERPKRLKVTIENAPTGIHAMDYTPVYVEYLIERKR